MALLPLILADDRLGAEVNLRPGYHAEVVVEYNVAWTTAIIPFAIGEQHHPSI